MADQPQMNQEKLMQVIQQKIGNLEITLNALMAVLQDKGEIEQEEINEKAQEIVQELRERYKKTQEKSNEQNDEKYPL